MAGVVGFNLVLVLVFFTSIFIFETDVLSEVLVMNWRTIWHFNS